MKRYLLTAGVSLLVGGLIAWGHLRTDILASRRELTAAQEVIHNLQTQAARDRKLLDKRARLIQAQAAENASQARSLQEALQAAEDWSKVQVPPEVREALLGRSVASQEHP